jgi:hypothetical protein
VLPGSYGSASINGVKNGKKIPLQQIVSKKKKLMMPFKRSFS